METQSAELDATKRQLDERAEELQLQQRSAGVRMQELQSQRDAMAKALRQSRVEADAAVREAQEFSARSQAVESALVSMGQQVAEYESAKQSLLLQQQALLQQQEEVIRRERVADGSCRSFATARVESQAVVAALKLELSTCNAQLQRAQAQLNMLGGSQGALQRLEEVNARLKRRGRTAAKVVAVRFVFAHAMRMTRLSYLSSLLTNVSQLAYSGAAVAACFAAWAKCLHQRRFQSLSSAAEAVQRQMHSIESMFNTQMSSITSERDATRQQLHAEQDKVLRVCLRNACILSTPCA